MNNINATIAAGGMCKFGVRQASYLDMAQEAAKDCLDDLPGLTPKDIDGLLFASTFVGRRSCQANTAPVVAERLGIKPTSICARLDVLCAGGSTGILLAKGLVESGMAKVVLVVGCEKLYTPEMWQIQYDEISAIDHEHDGGPGLICGIGKLLIRVVLLYRIRRSRSWGLGNTSLDCVIVKGKGTYSCSHICQVID